MAVPADGPIPRGFIKVRIRGIVLGHVSGHGSGSDGLPRLHILAGRDDGMSAAVSDSIVVPSMQTEAELLVSTGDD
jgi:hypothetical protein